MTIIGNSLFYSQFCGGNVLVIHYDHYRFFFMKFTILVDHNDCY